MMNRRSFLGNVSVLLGSGLAALVFPQAGRALLLDPPDDGDWDWWRNLDRNPLTDSDDPIASALIRAAAARRDLWIVYAGGCNPGESRKISPQGAFAVKGYSGIYAEAFCHKRGARRTFRVERITSVV